MNFAFYGEGVINYLNKLFGLQLTIVFIAVGNRVVRGSR